MKTKEVYFFIALIAFALSVMSIFGNHCKLSSGSAVAIIAVCTTMIVGMSIIDTLALRNALERIDSKIELLNSRINELNLLEEKVCKLRRQCNILFHHSWGLSYLNSQPYDALCEFWKALELCARENDIRRGKSCLQNIEIALNTIINNTAQHIEWKDKKDMSSPFSVSKEMKESSIYVAYCEKIEELIDKINKLHNM